MKGLSVVFKALGASGVFDAEEDFIGFDAGHELLIKRSRFGINAGRFHHVHPMGPSPALAAS
jgi:hypothetical protein